MSAGESIAFWLLMSPQRHTLKRARFNGAQTIAYMLQQNLDEGKHGLAPRALVRAHTIPQRIPPHHRSTSTAPASLSHAQPQDSTRTRTSAEHTGSTSC